MFQYDPSKSKSNPRSPVTKYLRWSIPPYSSTGGPTLTMCGFDDNPDRLQEGTCQLHKRFRCLTWLHNWRHLRFLIKQMRWHVQQATQCPPEYAVLRLSAAQLSAKDAIDVMEVLEVPPEKTKAWTMTLNLLAVSDWTLGQCLREPSNAKGISAELKNSALKHLPALLHKLRPA